MPGGGTVPSRLPAGTLSYLDRDQYISNMEVVAYFPGVNLGKVVDLRQVAHTNVSYKVAWPNTESSSLWPADAPEVQRLSLQPRQRSH